jgi:tetratricopeptide (TPR) repeat protein
VSIDRERILQAAQKYVDKKKYDRAIAEYQKIVQEDPTDARILLKIGDLQARLQAYPEAIATYDRVGQYYSSQGFALKAIAVYKQIRELIRKHSPQLADRYGHIIPKLAEIYTQLGLTSDALSAYDEVATRLQKNGRDRDAIEIFSKMVELDSTNPLPHLRLAEACCRVQSVDEAIDSFWTAAELLLNLGRHDDAQRVIERILHFRPDPQFARVAAELYLQKGTREDGMQALAKLQIAFQADPKNLDTLGLLAQAFTSIGQEAKALEVYKEMARIARDQGRTDLFSELAAHLRAVAPHDDGVRALLSIPPTSEPQPSARSSQSGDLDLHDSDLELVDEAPSVQPVPPLAAPIRSARPVMVSAPDVVIVDEDVEAAEEFVEDESFDARAHARKAVIDAESFRKLRLYSKAVEALRIALEIDPRSLDIRHKLREVLIEAGDRDGAIGETITLAAIHLDRKEPHLAEPLLYEVLEVEPEHPAALEMFAQIAPAETYSQARDKLPSIQEIYESYDPGEPLPSYDLEEISASHAMPQERTSHSSRPQFDSFSIVDDPFTTAPSDVPVRDAPLPSFPLGAEEDIMAGLVDQEGAEAEPEFIEEDIEEVYVEGAIDSHEAVEEALEEADFFASRGLWEDARAILTDQLTRSPKHPLLSERLREVDGAIAAAGESQTIERSQLAGSQQTPPKDRGFDITASLDALDELAAPPSQAAQQGGSSKQHDFADDSEEVDVDQVFAKFKAGVRAQVAESDSATHYDLGVAYKEMGLLPDAIQEFELAARDAQRECMCYAMIGMIHLEQSKLDEAAAAYIRGLEAQGKTVEQEMSLYYDLGNVYEMKNSNEDALYYFQKIARRDPGFRDVKDRIAALQPQKAQAASASRAVNDEDEFDRVFDDLFDSK